MTKEHANKIVKFLNQATTYILNHGEYSRPIYTVRKVRGDNNYYIHVSYYYYQGTYNTPRDGKLCDEAVSDAEQTMANMEEVRS